MGLYCTISWKNKIRPETLTRTHSWFYSGPPINTVGSMPSDDSQHSHHCPTQPRYILVVVLEITISRSKYGTSMAQQGPYIQTLVSTEDGSPTLADTCSYHINDSVHDTTVDDIHQHPKQNLPCTEK